MAVSIQELRNALAAISGATYGPDDLVTDDMRPRLARNGAIYADAAREVNERLFKCEQLLGLGQRSEALRQAMIDPDLLKLCGELDIPNRAAWTHFAGRNGLPFPAATNAAATRSLNAAFAAEDVVKEPLQEFRTLSLMRAPLPQRLRVLRLLVRAEPANVVWLDDLGRYEQTRCDEIRGLAPRIWQKRDWELAAQLVAEVESKDWVNPPKLDVIDAVFRAREKLWRDEANRAFNTLAGRIDDEVRFVDQIDADRTWDDLAAVKAVRADIQSVADRFELRADDPLLDRFKPAFAWLKQKEKELKRREEFDKAVGELARMLKDSPDWWPIEQAYQRAAAFDLPLPDDVRWAYASARRKRGILKQVLIVGGVALAFVAVIVLLLLKKS